MLFDGVSQVDSENAKKMKCVSGGDRENVPALHLGTSKVLGASVEVWLFHAAKGDEK